MQLPGARDCHGRLLVHVFVRKMDTAAFTADETTRAVHFMVEAALRVCPSAQARGLVFLIDMTDSSELTITSCLRSMLPLVSSSSLPVRVGQIFCINPPSSFKILFSMARSMLNQKMSSRIRVVTPEGAQVYFILRPVVVISASCLALTGPCMRGAADGASSWAALRATIGAHDLLVDYGGRLCFAHADWMAALDACLNDGSWPALPVRFSARFSPNVAREVVVAGFCRPAPHPVRVRLRPNAECTEKCGADCSMLRGHLRHPCLAWSSVLAGNPNVCIGWSCFFGMTETRMGVCHVKSYAKCWLRCSTVTWTRSGSLTYGPPETVRRIVAFATSQPSRNCLRVDLRQRTRRHNRCLNLSSRRAFLNNTLI